LAFVAREVVIREQVSSEQWAVNTDVVRPDPALVAALAALSTTQIADSGTPVGVVGPGVRRLAGGAEVCGPAVTVWTKPGDILFVLKANVAVQCGGVAVRPGDVVRADSSGVVVVPREHVAAVVAAAEVVADREAAWRAAIAGGATLPAATGIDDLLAALRPADEPPAP
jgi:regulator of RNase E activity RraA